MSIKLNSACNCCDFPGFSISIFLELRDYAGEDLAGDSSWWEKPEDRFAYNGADADCDEEQQTACEACSHQFANYVGIRSIDDGGQDVDELWGLPDECRLFRTIETWRDMRMFAGCSYPPFYGAEPNQVQYEKKQYAIPSVTTEWDAQSGKCVATNDVTTDHPVGSVPGSSTGITNAPSGVAQSSFPTYSTDNYLEYYDMITCEQVPYCIPDGDDNKTLAATSLTGGQPPTGAGGIHAGSAFKSKYGNQKYKTESYIYQVKHTPTASCYLKVWGRKKYTFHKLAPVDSYSGYGSEVKCNEFIEDTEFPPIYSPQEVIYTWNGGSVSEGLCINDPKKRADSDENAITSTTIVAGSCEFDWDFCKTIEQAIDSEQVETVWGEYQSIPDVPRGAGISVEWQFKISAVDGLEPDWPA
jgi:hypothetical protein